MGRIHKGKPLRLQDGWAECHQATHGLNKAKPMSPKSLTATIDPEDAARFAAIADEWWDPDGPFRPLHKLNPARLSYIRDTIGRHKKCDAASLRPFKGVTVLDLGCGGGLIAEPLSRLGASVTGIDVSDETIAVASAHAKAMGLDITYLRATAEDMAAKGETFDVVTGLEVIEHVADPALFLSACRTLVKDDGLFLFSTLNRTVRSFIMGIVAAEYILGWVPRGTHDWKQFVTPDAFTDLLEKSGFKVEGIRGLSYVAGTDSWRVSHDTGVNYIGHAIPHVPEKAAT